MLPRLRLLSALVCSCCVLPAAQAAGLIAQGSLDGHMGDLALSTAAPLENGVPGNLLGGLGSGLTWAGGSTYLALPDRGPNAVPWNAGIADTTSYIPRFQTLNLSLDATNGGALPYSVAATLQATTLLYTTDALSYGSAPSLASGGTNYFSGRSDAFDAAKGSLNPLNARLDPEGIAVSSDGRTVYISDEYGPYVYAFDRATGQRLASFALPANLGVANLAPTTAAEVGGNTTGRVANKGMEGLTITPDGRQLVGFMQSPLLQDGGDGGRVNRIVTIDIDPASPGFGQTHQYAFDNRVAGKNYNSSELLALNDHQFLLMERDGKGLGDGSSTGFKQIWLLDIAGATDVSNLSGEANLLPYVVSKKLFLDVRAALKAAGYTDATIPAKLEGLAWGRDVMVNGVLEHTLWVANDNDFLADASVNGMPAANPNQWFVFGFTDGELAALGASYVPQGLAAAVPEPGTLALLLPALGLGALAGKRRRTLRG